MRRFGRSRRNAAVLHRLVMAVAEGSFRYSSRTSLMTAPDGFWVSTNAFPFTVNSYWFPAPPMANALLATMAFVRSMFPVTVYAFRC